MRHLRGFENWDRLTVVSRILSQRQIDAETSCEDCYHIASTSGAKHILAAVRPHWGIENELHWTLDITFDEDHSRLRKDHGAENLALLRHIALSLLKRGLKLEQQGVENF